MATLASFAKYVRPEVPMCPEIQILDAVLRAGIEFCMATKIFQQTVPLTTIVDEPEYDLTLLMSADSEPDEIIMVQRDFTVNLEPTSQYDALQLMQTYQSGTPYWYYLDDRNLHLVLTPNLIETLKVTIKARPSRDAATLPDVLYRQYVTDVAAGAKAILMSQSTQPWTNLENAAINKTFFNQAIAKENLRYAQGNSRKKMRTRSHSF